MRSKRLFRLAPIAISLLCFAQPPNAAPFDPVPLVDGYLAARLATMQPGATEKDVDKALTYLADDAVYEHPRAKARIVGKSAMRAGMIGFLGGSGSVEIKTLNRMSNPVAVVVEQRVDITMKKEGGKISQMGHDQITVFEFKDGKISRIIDYWVPGNQ